MEEGLEKKKELRKTVTDRARDFFLLHREVGWAQSEGGTERNTEIKRQRLREETHRGRESETQAEASQRH